MPETYGERVRAARIEKGWSMNKLATEAELLARTVRRIENELTAPRDSTWQRLVEALGEI